MEAIYRDVIIGPAADIKAIYKSMRRAGAKRYFESRLYPRFSDFPILRPYGYYGIYIDYAVSNGAYPFCVISSDTALHLISDLITGREKEKYCVHFV